MLNQHDFMPRDRLAFLPAAAPATAASDERPTVRAGIVDGITVVEVLDAETLFTEEAIADLTAQLRRLVEAGHTRMVLDFRAVRSVSSDVLGTLAGLHLRLEKLAGRLSLCGLDPVLRDMLRICHLDRVFDIDPIEDAPDPRKPVGPGGAAIADRGEDSRSGPAGGTGPNRDDLGFSQDLTIPPARW
jgi:anti-anti-sigma factor